MRGAEHSQGHGPEEELNKAIQSTRRSLLQTANLASSELARKRPPSSYIHYQEAGQPDERKVQDDHQSPVQPNRYTQIRILPAMAFYQRRIPTYARRAMYLKFSVILLGVSASILAHYKLNSWVIISASLGSAITSVRAHERAPCDSSHMHLVV